jgi:hypothetical protein
VELLEKAAQNAEMRRFNKALRRVVSVSKTDLQKLLAEERESKVGKQKRGPRPHSSVSDPSSTGSD